MPTGLPVAHRGDRRAPGRAAASAAASSGSEIFHGSSRSSTSGNLVLPSHGGDALGGRGGLRLAARPAPAEPAAGRTRTRQEGSLRQRDRRDGARRARAPSRRSSRRCRPGERAGARGASSTPRRRRCARSRTSSSTTRASASTLAAQGALRELAARADPAPGERPLHRGRARTPSPSRGSSTSAWRRSGGRSRVAPRLGLEGEPLHEPGASCAHRDVRRAVTLRGERGAAALHFRRRHPPRAAQLLGPLPRRPVEARVSWWISPPATRTTASASAPGTEVRRARFCSGFLAQLSWFSSGFCPSRNTAVTSRSSAASSSSSIASSDAGGALDVALVDEDAHARRARRPRPAACRGSASARGSTPSTTSSAPGRSTT